MVLGGNLDRDGLDSLYILRPPLDMLSARRCSAIQGQVRRYGTVRYGT